MPAAEVLVVGPAWIGDMVMADSLFRLLHEREPGIRIDVVGPPWSVPLVTRMAEVRAAFALPVAHGEPGIGTRRRLGRQLIATAYDRAIVLPRSFKSALVPWFANIPIRTGYSGELRGLLLNDTRQLDRKLLDQTVKRFVALGLPAGEALPDPPPFPRLAADTTRQTALQASYCLGRRPAVALMPGAAYGPAKQWPIEHFAALARLLRDSGREVWVLGAAGERVLGDRIAAAGDDAIHNLCGRTTLADTIDLLASCQAAVSNDSGLMHVAAAVGTHVVAVYGSTSPAFTPPLTGRQTVHYLALDCSPCFARECPLGHLDCLRKISPEAVFSALTG